MRGRTRDGIAASSVDDAIDWLIEMWLLWIAADGCVEASNSRQHTDQHDTHEGQHQYQSS
jgi:hypothetical protein